MNLIHPNCINKPQFSSSQLSVHGVPQRSKKFSAVRVSNFAATTTTEVAADNGTARRSLTSSNDSQNKSLSLEKSSSAMEQLDIERGVCIPFRKYSPETVRNKVLESRQSIASLILRGVEIVWNLGFYWSSLMYDCLVGRDEEVVPFRARQLRNLLCDLGPSFIKAGQVLANRPDIIREDYMNELCILQDDVPPFPNQVAFKIIEEELGQPLEALFSKISSETIAAASLGQVYRATLRSSGEDVAIKVQRPQIEPIIYRDLFLFRTLASFLNGISIQKLGCNAELIVDEFGEKLLEELDYTLEARNIEDFIENFKDDPTVKIPRVYKNLSGSRVLVMEWIDGIRCTDPQAIKNAGIDVNGFLTVGVSAALRQLLEFGLFHGDPHPGNIFAMRDGRIAYVDFGNVAVLSQQNKQILIDAVVHAVNEDYAEMANDFTRLGFLASGTDVSPIIPALEAIWQNSAGKGLSDFNFRSVTGQFNKLVYNYPIRIPERFSLVIRSLLTQEGICFTLKPDFKFLEVAYPYVAKRLLTDPNPALRERLIQVLFKDGVFQWKRLENLIVLAKENVAKMSSNPALQKNDMPSSRSLQVQRKLDLTDTIKDGARLFLFDEGIRRQLLLALTEDSKLHVQELVDVYRLVEDDIDVPSVAVEIVQDRGREKKIEIHSIALSLNPIFNSSCQEQLMASNLKQEDEEEIKQDQFQRLPDDVVMLVINKLIHMKTLIRFSLVAKRYSSLVPQTHSLFVDFYTPPPPTSFMGHLGAFLRNLVAKFRRAPNPITQKLSLIKDGTFKQLKHLHLHYGTVNPSAAVSLQSGSSCNKWVSVYGSKSQFETCVCLMASSVLVNQSNSNPSVAGNSNTNSDMLAYHNEDPELFLDLFIMMLKHLRERNDIIREVVLDCKTLETVVFTDDKILGGNFIMGKELIARLQGKLEVSNSDPEELLAWVVHVPTLVLPKSGYTMNDVIIILASPDDQDHETVEVMDAEEDGDLELAILDGSVLKKWEVLDEAVRVILDDDKLDENTKTLCASYIPFHTLMED
ncbi:hypothetical protein CCACVL1_09800 [Corchorus capsularis]|uniref:Protein kinase domain-containing protein n=1 Tax=Corchorus capsularis TaxID=210143 RepID=A0A1R3IU86_COCAP|nr:hypothetical protein CCACVL1_09800 [Corchorus capsularis]